MNSALFSPRHGLIINAAPGLMRMPKAAPDSNDMIFSFTLCIPQPGSCTVS
jgi:hypothetical protein